MSWIPLAALLFRDSYMFSFYLYIFQSMSHVWDFHSIFYFLHQNQYTSSVQIPRKKNKLSHYGIEITGILVVFDDCSINRFVWKSDGNCQSAFVSLILSGIPIWADTSWLHIAYGCPCTLLIIYSIETLSTQAQWMMARYSSSSLLCTIIFGATLCSQNTFFMSNLYREFYSKMMENLTCFVDEDVCLRGWTIVMRIKTKTCLWVLTQREMHSK